MADPISGELVIVPYGVADDLEKIQWTDDDAKEFCESYEKNGYSDYRLITKAEALAILDNAELVAQLGLPVDDDYWTSEYNGAEGAWYFSMAIKQLSVGYIGNLLYALPIRSEVVPET